MKRGDKRHIGGGVVVTNGQKVIGDELGGKWETMDELIGDVPKGTRVTVLFGGTEKEQDEIIDRF